MTRDLSTPRHDWTLDEVESLFARPFMELVYDAATVHRAWFDPSEVQKSQLLSIKTGGCAENCGYCSQSASFDTGLKAEKLMDATAVLAEAMAAKAGGASRFCMGAAWRELKDRDTPKLATMIAGVKALGLETCATLGMLTADQARQLKAAGLDYYNHVFIPGFATSFPLPAANLNWHPTVDMKVQTLPAIPQPHGHRAGR